jgi:hypothetical protein
MTQDQGLMQGLKRTIACSTIAAMTTGLHLLGILLRFRLLQPRHRTLDTAADGCVASPSPRVIRGKQHRRRSHNTPCSKEPVGIG